MTQNKITATILLPRGTIDSLSARNFTAGELVQLSTTTGFKSIFITKDGIGLVDEGAAEFKEIELSAIQSKLSSGTTVQAAIDAIDVSKLNNLSTYNEIKDTLSVDGYALSADVYSTNDVYTKDELTGDAGILTDYYKTTETSSSTEINNALTSITDSLTSYAEIENLGISYDSVSKKIYFAGGNNTSAEIDASDFIKDGMLDNAEYVASAHTIVLTFNTDSGTGGTAKTALSVDVGDLVDTYTAAANASTIQLAVSNNEFSANVVDGSITPVMLSATADWIFDCN